MCSALLFVLLSCALSTGDASTPKKSSNLYIAPYRIVLKTNETFGKPVKFYCFSKVSDNSTLRWSKVSKGSTEHMKADSNVLTIDPLSAQDIGVYECVDKATGERVKTQLLIKYNIRAEYVIQPRTVKIKGPGEDVVFTCTCDSKVYCERSWRVVDQNGKDVSKQLPPNISADDEGVLTIKNITQDQIYYDFQCEILPTTDYIIVPKIQVV